LIRAAEDISTLKAMLLLTVLIAIAAPASAMEVAVIANRSVPVNQIDQRLLFDLYSGDIKEWDNGDPIVLVDLAPKSDVKAAFYDFLGKSASRMKSIWMRNLLTGEGQPPESVETQEAILEMVATTPGAIGYIDSKLVNEQVITLTVIRYGDD
jgi:ABC-type phosphate transport system substrate-binding protein